MISSAPDGLPMRDTRLIWFVLITILFNVVAFSLLGYLVREALNTAAANTHRIEVNAYAACLDFNRGFARFNAVIDKAIVDEQAKPHPDEKTLTALRDFRLPIRDCGPRP